MAPLHWDLFCHVIDNHGDLGVCWRLARRLVALGGTVRLWVDDASALAWMAPGGNPGIELMPWRDPLPHEHPGEVVIEAFGCDPPAGFVAAMATRRPPPVWINLEYLSAETYVERSHGLASPPSAGPGRGLSKWFFYPGFTPATGGLLLEDGLHTLREPPPVRDARRVSLFCYEQPALPAWLDAWSAAAAPPTTLFVTPGHATRQVGAWLGRALVPGDQAARGALAVHALPWLSQPDYDRLLRSCDLNLVRGEDSLVRALWAGRPFAWQIYPQADGAHRVKLDAFIEQQFGNADAALRAAWRHWGDAAAPAAPSDALFGPHVAALASATSTGLAAQQAALGDLGSRLYDFVLARR